MSVPSHFRFLFFFSAVSFLGCSAPVNNDTDELSEIGERIGEVREAISQGDGDWWKNLGWVRRNSAIISRANQDDGQYVGLNCKKWVRKVVQEASQGVVIVPSTSPDEYGWKWYPSPYVYRIDNIYEAIPGDIVQMNLRKKSGGSGPHSAIITKQQNGELCWIESNWHEKTDPNKVFSRCETIDDFLNRVTINGVQRYSVYMITGGGEITSDDLPQSYVEGHPLP